ncbi:protein KRI1 homolog [Phalaenopsis equestris]|uniref:protein KRI1 homolog n=1 Tax=Phalaenopsis equestris TaxID=78828 RepID=UPI0009E30544|nr:protein KRI1 homolog [Phalaenopsis equestris]XP_020578548.1 protein KRI1 homolog [Phalaenopsis equestris]
MGIELLDDDDSSTDEADLSKLEINEDFAKRFEYNKKREALQKCEELRKRGLISDSDESSDESSEEEEIKDDYQFYDALVRVKKNDPIVMQKDAKLFASSSEGEEEEEDKKSGVTKKAKPLYLKDVMARQLMEEGPEFEEEPLKKNPKVYSREQVEGLKAFLEAEKEAFGSVVDDDDDGMIIEQKKGNRKDTEENEDGEMIHKKVDEFFGEDKDLTEDEMFLKNYCLNKMWVNKERDKETYDDIGVSEDEDELEKQEQYEAEYNFRHEEEKEDRVLGHSRIADGSVRKKSSSRKTQRKNKVERMAQAEFERKEELKHLKNLKKKEIQEKLESILVTAGIGKESAYNLDAAYLEEDFDPEEYDKAMKEMFGADYYNTEDVDPGFGSDGGDDLEKPDFDKEDKLIGLTEGWDSVDTMEGFEGMRKLLLKKSDEEEEPSHIEGKRKRKQKISLREKVELDKELEEYYKLDYEGTIGDLKTRFKYRSVSAESYGLQVEEILMANDKDLNQYVSLKKLAPYREKEWKVTYHQKLKKNMFLQGGKSDDKIYSKKHRTEETRSHKFREHKEPNEDANTLSKRSKKRRMHAHLKLSKSRLLAYGKIPSKQHKNH